MRGLKKGQKPGNLNYLHSLPRTLSWRKRVSDAMKGDKTHLWRDGQKIRFYKV